MRRKKADVEYWNRKVTTMFTDVEGSRLVGNRYNALRYLLRNRYNFEVGMSKESTISMLKDAVYLDRKLRKETEGEEVELKNILSDEVKIELGYIPEFQYHE